MSAGPAIPTISTVAAPHEPMAGIAPREHREESHHSVIALRTVWGDYFSILWAHAALTCLTLAGLTFSARLLGPEAYGTVVLFMTVVQLFFIVGIKWSFPALMRFGREALVRERSPGRVFWAWSPLFLCTLVMCSLCLLVGSQTIASMVGIQGPHIWVYPMVFALTSVGMAAVQFLQVCGKMRVAAWAPVTGKLVLAVLLVIFSLWCGWRMTPALVILCMAVALLLQVILSLPFVERRMFSPVIFDWNLTWTMMRYSFPLWGGVLAGYVSEWIDLYFLRFFRGYADVGVYQISYQAFLFLVGGFTTLYTVLFPLLTAWMAEGREDRVVRYAVRLIPQASLLWGVLVLAFGVIQNPCFSMLFGSAFARCSQPFAILLVGSAFLPVILLYSPLFLALDHPTQNGATMVIMAIVNVLGDLWLVPTLGMIGAAFSTAVSFMVAACLCLSWGNRQFHIKYHDALIPAIVVAVSLVLMIRRGLGIRLFVCFGAIVFLIWRARVTEMFSRVDLSMLTQVRCPQWATLLITKLYAVLSRDDHFRSGLRDV